MGNEDDYRRDNIVRRRINLDDIIENDCYEEVDLKKINKIKNIERKWNENSIIYSANDLKDLREEIGKSIKVDEPKNDNPELIEEKNDNVEKKDDLNNIENTNNNNNNDKNDNNDNNNIDNNNNNNIDNGQKNIEVQNENLENEQNNNIRNDALIVQNEEQNNLNKNKEEPALNPKTQNNINSNNDNNNIAGNDNKKTKSEEFDIKNIIPEYRLTHLKKNDIIYCGNLQKIFKITGNNAITYSERFCIFTKTNFSYYKSKEIYLSINKPILTIENKYIIRIENTSLNNGNYYFGIICEVNENTKYLIEKANSFVTNEGNTHELLLGFKTKDYKSMMKWVTVLKYFISNQNNQT